MSQYYYLAAQLPGLTYGQNVPMTSVAFAELAREHLAASDAEELERCTLALELPPTDNAAFSSSNEESGAAKEAKSQFVRKWKEWERTLRLNLARNRAKKLKREDGGFAWTADYPFDAAAAARAACAMESPLEAEIFLDKARWDTIESLQGLDIFSMDSILAYKLKLLLMERRMSFNTEEGYTEYKGLYAAILGDQR